MNADIGPSQRRLAVAARAPGLERTAARCSSRRSSPDLAASSSPTARALARLGLTTGSDRTGWRRPTKRSIDVGPALARRVGRRRCCRPPSADYPPLLRESPDAPAVLYVRGDVRILGEPQLAMVGSRNPTAGGRATAREFAAFFARAGHHHHQWTRARHRRRLPRRCAAMRRSHRRRARLRARPDLPARESGARGTHRRQRRAGLGISAGHAAAAGALSAAQSHHRGPEPWHPGGRGGAAIRAR